MSEYNLGTAKGKLVLDTTDFDRGIDSANAKMDGFAGDTSRRAQAMQAASAGLLAVGTAGVAGFALAVNAAADFEERISAIGAVSNATEGDLDRLRDKALQLGRDTAYGATEAAFAMEELSKAGLSVEDILNGAADATVALAAAGEVDLTTAATIASNAMNQFGLSAEQLPRVADLIAGAANASAIDVNDFGLSLQQSGAVANLVGLEFDDLAVAITAMGNAGVRGSDAGTSLKTFLTGLQPVTDKQKQLFYDLGLAMEQNITAGNELGNTFFDAEGNIKSLSEIAGILNGALAGMSEAQKTATLEALFGSDAIRAAAIIAEQGAGGFDTLAASMNEITAAEVADKRLDNLNGRLTILKGSLQTLMIEAGTPFLEMLTNVAEKVTEWVNALSNVSPEIMKIVVGVTAIASAFAVFAGGAGLAIRFLGPAVAAVNLLTGAVARLTLVLLTNPIVLLIVAIAALVAGIIYAYQNFEEFRRVVDRIIDVVVEVAQAIQEWFINTALPALQRFADFFADEIIPRIQAFVEDFIAIVTAIIDVIVNDIIPVIVQVAGEIQDAFAEAWAWIEANVLPTVEAIVEFIVAAFERLSQFFQRVLVPAIQGSLAVIVPIVQGAFTAIVSVVQAAMTIIQSIVSFVLDAINIVWRLFGDNLLSYVGIVFNFIREIIESVLSVIQGIFQIFTAILTGDWQKFLDGLKNIWDGIWQAIRTIVDTVLAAIVLIVQTFFDVLNAAWQLALAGLENLWNITWTAIKLAVELVLNFIKTFIETTLNGIQAIVAFALSALGLAWETFWNALKIPVQVAWEIIQTVVGTAVGEIQNAINVFTFIVTDMWNRFWNGLKDIFTTVWGLFRTAFDTAINLFQLALEIAIAIITSIWQGLWDGIVAIFETAKGLFENIVDGIVGFFEDIIDVVGDVIDWIQDLIDKILSIPTPDLTPGFDLPGFGGFLAAGAIVKDPMLAVIGEAGPEAVIPLNNERRAMELMMSSGLADMLLRNSGLFDGSGGSSSGGTSAGIGPVTVSSGGPAVVVQEAHFHEQMQYDSFLSATEAAVAARRFG